MCDENPVLRSLAMIEERIQEKLTVENLADSLHISKYHYQRLFREAVGDSVMRYVTRRRLTMAAKELAERADITVLEVALRYGYDSHEGFTRSFRALMGVTPTEYRKYRHAIAFPDTQKERCAMLYSKTTDEMLRELNALIVQAKETADYTRKNKAAVPKDAAGYAQYWENIADKADAMAEKLGGALQRITAIAQRPDEISAHFMIIKAIEDAAFWSNVIAFETGLTTARAKPEHQTAFVPICNQYGKLAHNAQISVGKVVEFFSELSALIVQDMRKNAEEQIEKTIEKGRAAVKLLSSDSGLPYAYIAEEIKNVTDELSTMPLDRISVQSLEDYLFRLDIVAFAASADIWRMPSHKGLFDGISALREQLCAAMDFFRSFSGDTALPFAKPQESSGSAYKKCSDIGFQGNILLFYLKGELQKLGSAHLSEKQQAAFGAVCSKLSETIQLAYRASAETDAAEIGANFRAVYEEILTQVKEMGEYAGPLRYIAENINTLGAVAQ